jgi:hypothetical protein
MNLLNNLKQKSPIQRFLFILGLFLFLLFLSIGFVFIFWDNISGLNELETKINSQQRLYFGILLVVYGTYRFIKLMNKKEE